MGLIIIGRTALLSRGCWCGLQHSFLCRLGRLLVAAYRSPVMPEFIATLPLVAYDGTMKKRLKSDRVSGQAHIKTGSLSDVRSLGGYVLDRNGRRATRDGLRDKLMTVPCEPGDRNEKHAGLNLPGVGSDTGNFPIRDLNFGQPCFADELMQSHPGPIIRSLLPLPFHLCPLTLALRRDPQIPQRLACDFPEDRRCDGAAMIGVIVDDLAGKFNAPRQVIMDDVKKLVQDFRDKGVLKA